MNSKTGIALVVVGGILVLCCGGGFFLSKNTLEKVQKTTAKNKEFVKEALGQTGATWDVKVFLKYADDSFAAKDKADRTEKMFQIFKSKLGKLQILEEVTNSKTEKPFELMTSADGKGQAFLTRLVVPAKFEKGSGVFKVSVKNEGPKQSILEISLNSNELMEMSKEDAKNAEGRLKKSESGTK